MAKAKSAGNEDGEKTDKAEKGTHQIRVHADLGEMIAWIIRIEGGTTAVLLDPMLRAQVSARYKKYETEIKKLKEAEEKMRKVEAEVKEQLKKKSLE